MKMEYIHKDTRIKYSYLQHPRYLDGYKLDPAPEAVYVRLYNRAILSQKTGFLDENGRIYVIYTIEDMAKDIRRSQASIKSYYNVLRKAGLIETQVMGYNQANRIYVKIPHHEEKPSSAGANNCPSGGQKLALEGIKSGSPEAKNYPSRGQNLAPSKTDKSKTTQQNIPINTCEAAYAYELVSVALALKNVGSDKGIESLPLIARQTIEAMGGLDTFAVTSNYEVFCRTYNQLFASADD